MLEPRLAPEIEKRLEDLARKTGRTKSIYAREGILRHLDASRARTSPANAWDEARARSASKRVRRSSGPGRPSERAALTRRARRDAAKELRQLGEPARRTILRYSHKRTATRRRPRPSPRRAPSSSPDSGATG